MDVSELVDRRDRIFGPGAPLFYDEPLHLVRGEGVYLYDADGRRYVDMYNNVPCVGHAHPHVVEAIHRQASILNVHSRYLHEGVLAYAERLVSVHDPSLQQVVFSCTGTEANEVALAMARAATGGRGIICTDRAYHGNSALVDKLTWARGNDREVRPIHFPQTYRPLEEGASEEELCELHLAELQAAIDGLAEDGIPLACMLVCSILANEGLPTIPRGFMRRAAERVRAAGGLFIADEVQAGFCRVGRFWGYEAMDFVPDIATMGKPMGNGMPVAGTVARPELMAAFRKSGYFNTFAASPLQAAAGMAVLDVIESEGLMERSARVGAHLRDGLAGIDHPSIGDLRGHGLFIGIEWVSDREARTPDREGVQAVVEGLKRRGFLLARAGALGNTLKIRPPLVFSEQHADAFLAAFEETVREIA